MIETSVSKLHARRSLLTKQGLYAAHIFLCDSARVRKSIIKDMRLFDMRYELFTRLVENQKDEKTKQDWFIFKKDGSFFLSKKPVTTVTKKTLENADFTL